MTEPPTRLDVELVRRGLARSRGQARELVAHGAVLVDGRAATKPSTLVTAAAAIDLARTPDRWVGRAAYKLLAALDRFGLDVTGRRCLDVGASTGGFTQVLLEAGAAHVTALDVGHGQLVPEVAADPRVEERSGTNIREVRLGDLGEPFDVVVADLSFISLRLVLPVLPPLMSADADAVLLVKPQFEVGRERLARTGVVTSPTERQRALEEVLQATESVGLHRQGLEPSPLRGTTGNQEYLLWVTTGLRPPREQGAP
ncbi:MAG TPA: TlyA family RNA methyltransferase [Lapillicoccus sp.]|nr:TlyA family RNA methyltransferase [Lapillicoccus sp.]